MNLARITGWPRRLRPTLAGAYADILGGTA